MTDRRYQDYSEIQLIELKRDIENDRADIEREQALLLKRYAAGGPIRDWMYSDEDYVGLAQQIDGYNEDLAAIRAEFDARNEERRRDREARESE